VKLLFDYPNVCDHKSESQSTNVTDGQTTCDSNKRAVHVGASRGKN